MESESSATIWLDAYGNGKRFIVRGDKMVTAFLELQRAIHGATRVIPSGAYGRYLIQNCALANASSRRAMR
jgi:hypothetical protein